MNYRHAFHAGNFADVLKHAVLTLVIEHLKTKPAPFRVIDTHAGRGRYDLGGGEATKTLEWLDGIGRLIGHDADPLPSDIENLLGPYLKAIGPFEPDKAPVYPGSPALALALMRDQDRLVANELHPEDRAALQAEIGRDPRAKVLGLDGWQALKALLPPKERRGVILVDPPFEEAGEFERLIQGLEAAMTRFATGIYLLWYPIKDLAGVGSFRRKLAAKSYAKLLAVELAIAGPGERDGLVATGVVVINPPFRLEAQLRTLAPFLVARLGKGRGAGCRIDRLAE